MLSGQDENASMLQVAPMYEHRLMAMWLPRRATQLHRFMDSGTLGIPITLEEANLTAEERAALQALYIRGSWLLGTCEDMVTRLRRILAGVTAASLAGWITILAVHDAPQSGASWYCALGMACTAATLFACWRSTHRFSKRWEHSSSDWDVRLKGAIETLQEMFSDEFEEFGSDFVDIGKVLEAGYWLDDAVWSKLGAADSLGMMRLTDALENIPDTVTSLDLDGDTQELVSRVAEVARDEMRSAREVTVSAMRGISLSSIEGMPR